MRVGMGYDVHQLVSGRDLWMGGIKIEHTMGLLGHSDADVLLHFSLKYFCFGNYRIFPRVIIAGSFCFRQLLLPVLQ